MEKLQLDEYQEQVLNAKGNIVLCTGRQVGKTTIMSMKAGKYMIDNPKSKIIIVSLTEDQAKLIIIMILDYLESIDKKMIQKGKNKPTQNRVVLKNGSSALARPVGNTGDAVRGFTGSVLIIDEASRMPALVWEASRPTLLTTGGEIWMCSTPFGKQGYFWEAFQNKTKKFKVFHISSEQVMRDRPITAFWTEEKRAKAMQFLEGERADMSELQYGQEYLGLFLEELRQFFTDELIEQVCVLQRRPEIRREREYSLGVDIARMGEDESSFEILDKINDNNLEQVENITTTKTLTTQTEDRIFALNKQYDEIMGIYVDAGSGSLGVGVFDHLLRNDDTKRKVIAINNRARALDSDGKAKTKLLKEDLYDNLRSLMEKRQIKLLDDYDIKLSLRSVQYEYVQSQKGLSQMRIFGNYTHIAEGLIRAAWCVKDQSLNIWIDSIRV
tara:strand:- start:470 stop:1795 length:1326 start_codon:yes stop_codon:yes gene_type:complete